MELRVTFSAINDDEVLSPEDLAEIELLVPESRPTTEPGEVGVGAAGFGIVVVLQVAEHIVNDLGSWVGLGLALRELIKWRVTKTKRSVTVTDEKTLGAIAASALPSAWLEDLSVTDYQGSQPLFGRAPPGPNWIGTDERDMWVATFKRPGDAIFIYLSPTGTVLAYVRVPSQTFYNGVDWVSRTQDEVAELFRRWNTDHDS